MITGEGAAADGCRAAIADGSSAVGTVEIVGEDAVTDGQPPVIRNGTVSPPVAVTRVDPVEGEAGKLHARSAADGKKYEVAGIGLHGQQAGPGALYGHAGVQGQRAFQLDRPGEALGEGDDIVARRGI